MQFHPVKSTAGDDISAQLDTLKQKRLICFGAWDYLAFKRVGMSEIQVDQCQALTVGIIRPPHRDGVDSVTRIDRDLSSFSIFLFANIECCKDEGNSHPESRRGKMAARANPGR